MRVTPDSLRAHLLEELLPRWAEHGRDRVRGGFWNRLAVDLSPIPDDWKRCLVQARHLYAFSRARELGAGDWSREAADSAFTFLRERFWDPRYGGFWTTVHASGGPLDRRKDLYVHAFAIFGLAHHARASGESEPQKLALETWGLLHEKLADPRAGGFFERADERWAIERGPRAQNPQMHLVEALLELGDAEAIDEARRLVALLGERWIDPNTGALREYFGPGWAPLDDSTRSGCEPGHGFEWTWLLQRYAERTGDVQGLGLARRLYSFASRYGVDRDGGVFDELRSDGRVARDSKRLWPQTERLKVRALEAPTELATDVAVLFDRYVNPQTQLWIEHLDRSGRAISSAHNATSVYHVVLALSEVIGALERR